MANPPRTHTTTSIVVNGDPLVYLPDDWEPGTRVAVVDLTALPPGLTPNLAGDGTYYGALRDVPKGWDVREDSEWTSYADYVGTDTSRTLHAAGSIIVQARPAPRPPAEEGPLFQGTLLDLAIILSAPPTHTGKWADERQVVVLVEGDWPGGGDR